MRHKDGGVILEKRGGEEIPFWLPGRFLGESGVLLQKLKRERDLHMAVKKPLFEKKRLLPP